MPNAPTIAAPAIESPAKGPAPSTGSASARRQPYMPAFLAVENLTNLPNTCPSCDSRRLYVLPYPSAHPRFRHLHVVGCGSCGLCWVPPGGIDLDAYYAGTYSTENRRDRSADPARYFRDLEEGRGNRWYYQRAQRHAGYLSSMGVEVRRVLEIGAGPGYFLHALRHECGQPERMLAIEPDPASAKYLQYLGVDITTLDAFDAAAPLDAVCASHSLEHFWIDQISDLLARIALALAEDGVFIGEVPLGSLLRHALGGRHEPHTIFFTYDALDDMLRAAGFQSLTLFHCNPPKCRPREDAVYEPAKWKEHDGYGSIVWIATKVANDQRLTHIRTTVSPAPSTTVNTPPSPQPDRALAPRVSQPAPPHAGSRLPSGPQQIGEHKRWRLLRKLMRDPRRFFADALAKRVRK